jgi:hypothetical protein
MGGARLAPVGVLAMSDAETVSRYCGQCRRLQDFKKARGSAHVVAWDSAHVVAWDSAHVEASGSAHVEASGSAHVEASGSAHVEARGSAHVVAWGSAHVVAKSPLSVVIRRSPSAKVTGRLVVDAFEQSTDPADWLRATGVKVRRGAAVLYKRVGSDWHTRNGVYYVPGTEVEAKDWDPGPECGNGLHFCADPAGGDLFREDEGDRYVACDVAVADIVVHARPNYPDKVKARRCRVLYECDRNGKKISEKTEKAKGS